MFNLSDEAVLKQCQAGGIKSDANAPIRKGETLEPCLRGADKILNDDSMSKMFRKILMQENTQE